MGILGMRSVIVPYGKVLVFETYKNNNGACSIVFSFSYQQATKVPLLLAGVKAPQISL